MARKSLGRPLMENKKDKIEIFDERGNSRGYYHPENQLNDLTGKEWVFATKSVIPKSYPPSFQQQLRNQHGGQKPPELCAELIETFTKKGEKVLDPFAGVGGTLLGCSITNRIGIGIEKNQKWIDLYKEVCRLEKINEQKIVLGDSKEQLHKLKEKFDFILTDIPFWIMDKAPKSKGVYKKHGEEAKGIYSDKSKLSAFDEDNPKTKEEWKLLLKNVFTICIDLLKENKYCAIFIGNMYFNGRYHLLNADLTEIMEQIGFVLKAEKIWYDVAKKLHLYGINYAFIPSIVHQYIMIYRK
ncbi:MAG: class I SAM-dependent methyltransferase [Candidatus Lokiarchaeota archaeon]|nr:class I SAM-dependent methyltransferase [Candidatus Lokiarchaeota archaeon]